MPYTHQLSIPGAAANDGAADDDSSTTTVTSLRADAVLHRATLAYAKDAKAKRTREAYDYHWREFTTWCAKHQVTPLPCVPQALATYLAHLAQRGRKVSSISLALTAISQAHKTTGHSSPRNDESVRLVFAGIRRTLGRATDQKAAITIPALNRLVRVTPTHKLIGARDRALILLGFASALRRTDLATLNAQDITDDTDGLRVLLRRSKDDPDGRGREIGIPYGGNPATCPVRALRAWKEASGINSGPLFVGMKHGKLSEKAMGSGAVARLLKKYAKRAGIDSTDIAGHSLRAGLVTAAAQAGKSEQVIMQQTGHKSVEMLRRYVRRATLFDDNAAAGIGL